MKEVVKDRRTVDQNSKLHALLTEISNQTQWAGEWMDAEDWKRLFVAHLHGQKVVPGLEGGFVVINRRTSKMTISQCSELIEWVIAWATMKGLKIREDEFA